MVEVRTYRNNRNENKYIEVVRYGCGHYHVVQFMKWGSLINKIGSRTGRRSRWTKEHLQELLEDYTRVETINTKLISKGGIWQHAVA